MNSTGRDRSNAIRDRAAMLQRTRSIQDRAVMLKRGQQDRSNSHAAPGPEREARSRHLLRGLDDAASRDASIRRRADEVRKRAADAKSAFVPTTVRSNSARIPVESPSDPRVLFDPSSLTHSRSETNGTVIPLDRSREFGKAGPGGDDWSLAKPGKVATSFGTSVTGSGAPPAAVFAASSGGDTFISKTKTVKKVYKYDILHVDDDDHDDWYWWDDHHHHGYHSYDYAYSCGDWDGWSFSLGFHGSGWSFGFGYHDGWYNPWYPYSYSFHHPWHWYDLHYHHCGVSYYRPYRHLYYSYVPLYYRFYPVYVDDSSYWWLSSAPAETTYASSDWYDAYDDGGGGSIFAQESSLEAGWSLLGAGSYEEARARFEMAASSPDHAAEGKLGSALASGLMGETDRAAVDLRSAVRAEPTVLERAPGNEAVQGRIRLLAERFGELARADLADVDALFMAAALRAMLGEHSLAFFAIDTAIERGDTDDSAFLLKALLEESLVDSF